MEPTDVVYDVCRYYIEDQRQLVDPALVAKIGGFHRSRNLAGLASCSCHFDSAFHSVDDWRFLRQIEAFFKKNSLFSSSEACAAAARESFIASEQQCRNTNLRLEYFYFNRDRLDPDVKSKILKMERYIRNVLGDFRSFLDKLPCLVKVTPGATAHSPRRRSLPQLKMRMQLYCTSGAATYLRTLYQYYGFAEPRLKEVSSNRIELVPKNWKTDRTIACEPEGNLPLQLAFDTYVKRRLRRSGIDLRDQSANRLAAERGSKHGGNATVDFKAASDTISYNAVAWLLPGEWLQFLDRIRTPDYRGAFGEGSYQKFSSMGNGATFTLETLLFAAACYAVGSKNFLVYGDDVIIEPELFDSYTALTRFLGFTINQEKTYTGGPFRESCGLDSFNGYDVTPVYIRDIDRRKASKCHLVNVLASLAFPDGALANFLKDLTISWKLPLVPYSENTTSGVWLDAQDARRLGSLKTKKFREFAKVLVPRHKARKFVDSRGYYLWFLNKNSQVLFSGPWELSRNLPGDETSSVSIFDHKYVRKWVSWQPPADRMPDHLYWWSEFVSARPNGLA